MIKERIIAALIGYVFGNFLFGFLYGKTKHIDLRTKGSGNVGSTNTLRNLGVPAGLLTLFFDCAKVILASTLVWLIYRDLNCTDVSLLMMYGAFGAVIGHDFPVILKFKGGKGIASSLGFIIIVCPEMLPIAITIFLLSVILTRYVSLGSILAASTLFMQSIVFYFLGVMRFKGSYAIEEMVIILFLSSLAIFLHRSNIDRLVHQKENLFSFHPKKA